MTAEIIIMNSRAIALAADSAITSIHDGGREKVFSSDNKIFELSDHAPVGIMTYGSADFMSIPWETIVEEFRRKLGLSRHSYLKDYAEQFMEFLREDIGGHISQEAQEQFIVDTAVTLLQLIRQEIQRDLRSSMHDIELDDDDDPFEIFENEELRITEQTIVTHAERARSVQDIEWAPEELIRRAHAILNPRLKRIREEIFGTELTPALVRQLNRLTRRTVSVMLDQILGDNAPYSGLVFTGFGEEELFPSLVEYRVEGFYGNMVKARQESNSAITPESDVSIRPFAQRDMVVLFMEGIAIEYQLELPDLVETKLEEYTEDLLAGLDQYDEEEREELAERLKPARKSVSDAFFEQLRLLIKENYVDHIVDIVAVLPKEQLAEMAESLISLTSLKRRVSSDEETVGGPTDVAVITKGDGLVWIKRKQYFEPGVNPAYFARTYGGNRYDSRNE